LQLYLAYRDTGRSPELIAVAGTLNVVSVFGILMNTAIVFVTLKHKFVEFLFLIKKNQFSKKSQLNHNFPEFFQNPNNLVKNPLIYIPNSHFNQILTNEKSWENISNFIY
jgi:hypothetical protein